MKSWPPDSPLPAVALADASRNVEGNAVADPSVMCPQAYRVPRKARPSRYAPLKNISEACLRRARAEQVGRAQQRKSSLRSDA